MSDERTVPESATCPKCDATLEPQRYSPGLLRCPTNDCGFTMRLVPGGPVNVKYKKIL